MMSKFRSATAEGGLDSQESLANPNDRSTYLARTSAQIYRVADFLLPSVVTSSVGRIKATEKSQSASTTVKLIPSMAMLPLAAPAGKPLGHLKPQMSPRRIIPAPPFTDGINVPVT